MKHSMTKWCIRCFGHFKIDEELLYQTQQSIQHSRVYTVSSAEALKYLTVARVLFRKESRCRTYIE